MGRPQRRLSLFSLNNASPPLVGTADSAELGRGLGLCIPNTLSGTLRLLAQGLSSPEVCACTQIGQVASFSEERAGLEVMCAEAPSAKACGWEDLRIPSTVQFCIKIFLNHFN